VHRRDLLRLGALAAGAFALDPERALWIPGARRVFDLGTSACVTESVLALGACQVWTLHHGEPYPYNLMTGDTLTMTGRPRDIRATLAQLVEGRDYRRQAA